MALETAEKVAPKDAVVQAPSQASTEAVSGLQNLIDRAKDAQPKGADVSYDTNALYKPGDAKSQEAVKPAEKSSEHVKTGETKADAPATLKTHHDHGKIDAATVLPKVEIVDPKTGEVVQPHRAHLAKVQSHETVAKTPEHPHAKAADQSHTAHSGDHKPQAAAGDHKQQALEAVKPVDPKKAEQDAEALHKLAGKDKWYGFGNRDMFADKDGINNLLETKSDAERTAIKAAYEKKYGEKLETSMHFAGENDSDFQKFQSVLNRKTNDVAGHASDRIGATLTEEKQGWLHKRDQPIIEQDLRDTLRTHNADQIQQIKADYAQSHPGHTLENDIKNDPTLSSETKQAAAIYMKGNDKLTFGDKEQLANLALQKKDMTMFTETMQNMSATDRQAFVHLGGAKKIAEAFGKERITDDGKSLYQETESSKKAIELATEGKLSAATEIQENHGLFKTNKDGVENVISGMSADDRQKYQIGKALESHQPVPQELHAANLNADQKAAAQKFYESTHEALKEAGNASQVTKWEDEITKSGGTFVSKLADHGSKLIGDNKTDIMKTVEGMSKSDWEDAKAHPERRAQVFEELQSLKGMRLNDQDVNDIMKAYDQKMGSKDFESSARVGNRDIISTLNDDNGLFKADRRAMLDALGHMSKEEQQRYRNDPDFKKQLDDAVISNLSTTPLDAVKNGEPASGDAYQAAKRILDGVSQGKEAKTDIVSKLAADANDRTDKAQVIRDVQQAFKDDPSLRDRINNPKNPADTQLSNDFHRMLHENLSDSDYTTYAKPLVETGHLAIDKQLDLDKGFFYNDKKGAFNDLLNATPAELQKMKSDTNYRDQVLSVLSSDEDKKVAMNIVEQGQARPEDKIRESVNHAGGASNIMEQLKGMKPEEVNHVKQAYQEKYGSSLEGDLYNKLSGENKKEATRILESNVTGEQAYNIARDAHYKEVSGFGAHLITDVGGSATVAQSQEAMNNYSQAIADANKNHQEIDASRGQELLDKLHKTDDNVAKTKASAANTAADLTVAAGGLVAAPFTGGLSLAGTLEAMTALGVVGAVGKVVAKGAIEGNDYEWSMGNVSADAGSGFVESAVSAVGPAQAARLFGMGERVATTAVEGTVADLTANGAESLLKAGGKEELMSASKDMMSSALAEGAKSIKAKEINQLAESVVSKELTGKAREEAVNKVANSLASNLGDALEQETANRLKTSAGRALAKGTSGFAAGFGGGTVEGASQWDSNLDVRANLANVGEKALVTGVVVGAAAATLSMSVDAFDSTTDKLADHLVSKIGERGTDSAKSAATAALAGAIIEKGRTVLKSQVVEKGSDQVKAHTLAGGNTVVAEASERTESTADSHGGQANKSQQKFTNSENFKSSPGKVTNVDARPADLHKERSENAIDA